MNIKFCLIFLFCFTTYLGINGEFNENLFNDIKFSRNFTGKVVLVTGSSSGIGKTIVSLFSYLGAKVVVHGKTPEHVKSTAQEVRNFSPEKLEPLEVLADVSKSENVKRILDETINKFGKLDVLVNNVAIGSYKPFLSKDYMKNFDEEYNVNLRSFAELNHLSVPYLKATNGSIVQISCIDGISPSYETSSYSIFNAAIIMMTKCLSLELGPLGIRINTVSSGMINTPLASKILPGQTINSIVEQTPLRRSNSPINVAKAVVFLSSSDASFITGDNLVVDGGLVYNFNNHINKN